MRLPGGSGAATPEAKIGVVPPPAATKPAQVAQAAPEPAKAPEAKAPETAKPPEAKAPEAAKPPAAARRV